ncbi:MAG: SAM-dependent methyltransferase [Proteobacteria bacterium]|nr:SAM-dependent methyltransferase [Pseudomonadota bacterium]
MDNQDINPGGLLKISGNYWKACTLHAGIKLDVFTAIGDDQVAIEDIAQKLEADERGVAMLLNALTAMELLAKTENNYSNTHASKAFLSKDSSQYIGYIIMHHHNLVDSWSKLSKAVTTGKPVRERVSHSEEETRESFLMGMFNIAMNLAPRLVIKINLSKRKHLLDLGGGPGTYAIHFCMNNPQLKATVYDLPTTRPFAQSTIEKFGLEDRIDFMDGDYLEDGIKGLYDVAWLSHILHGEGPEDCRKIINKTVSASEPGGMIIVHDFILDDTMDGPLFPALFSLNMLLGTENGQSYSEKQIKNMLADAGVKDMQRIPIQTPNDSGIITGIV